MPAKEEKESIDYEIFVNEIIRTFAKEMKKDFNLLCIGEGGSMPYDVESIEVSFFAYRKATIEEARELIIKANQRLIEIINEHKKIRPFLREYPFTSKRAMLSISFKKKNNMRYTDGSVTLAFHVYNRAKDRNIIHYFKADPKTEDLVDLLVEQYDEALKLVTDK